MAHAKAPGTTIGTTALLKRRPSAAKLTALFWGPPGPIPSLCRRPVRARFLGGPLLESTSESFLTSGEVSVTLSEMGIPCGGIGRIPAASSWLSRRRRSWGLLQESREMAAFGGDDMVFYRVDELLATPRAAFNCSDPRGHLCLSQLLHQVRT